MKRAKIGLGVLTLWGTLNILVAAAVTVMTLAKESPPALRLVMSADAIRRLDPQVLGVVNAQAVFANPCIIGFCVLVLTMLWSNRPSPKGGSRFSHSILVTTLLFVQIFAVGLTLVLTSSTLERAS